VVKDGPDPIALADQAAEEVRQAARVIATFYLTLAEFGVPTEDCHWLTRDYADALWRANLEED
jgi:hypothetical protein